MRRRASQSPAWNSGHLHLGPTSTSGVPLPARRGVSLIHPGALRGTSPHSSPPPRAHKACSMRGPLKSLGNVPLHALQLVLVLHPLSGASEGWWWRQCPQGTRTHSRPSGVRKWKGAFHFHSGHIHCVSCRHLRAPTQLGLTLGCPVPPGSRDGAWPSCSPLPSTVLPPGEHRPTPASVSGISPS